MNFGNYMFLNDPNLETTLMDTTNLTQQLTLNQKPEFDGANDSVGSLEDLSFVAQPSSNASKGQPTSSDKTVAIEPSIHQSSQLDSSTKPDATSSTLHPTNTPNQSVINDSLGQSADNSTLPIEPTIYNRTLFERTSAEHDATITEIVELSSLVRSVSTL
jgi:hypothetical protein